MSESKRERFERMEREFIARQLDIARRLAYPDYPALRGASLIPRESRR